MPRPIVLPSLAEYITKILTISADTYLNTKQARTNLTFAKSVLQAINQRDFKSENVGKPADEVRLQALQNDLLLEAAVGEKIGKGDISSLATLIAYANNLARRPYANCIGISIYGLVEALSMQLKQFEQVTIPISIVFFGGKKQSHFALMIGLEDAGIICDPWAGLVFPARLLPEIVTFASKARLRLAPEEAGNIQVYQDGRVSHYFLINPGQKLKCHRIIEKRAYRRQAASSGRKQYDVVCYKLFADAQSDHTLQQLVSPDLISNRQVYFNMQGELVKPSPHKSLVLFDIPACVPSKPVSKETDEAKQDAHQADETGRLAAKPWSLGARFDALFQSMDDNPLITRSRQRLPNSPQVETTPLHEVRPTKKARR